MRSRSEKGEHRLIKPLPALLALIAGAGVSATISLASSTEVGQTTATPVFGIQTPVVAASTVPGSQSYETPDGVLTSWRYHSSGDATAGAVRLKIFRHTGTGLVYEVLAESSLKTLAPSTAYEFKERIPVKKGNLLGLTAVDDAEVAITVPNTPGNQMAQFGGGDIAPGQTGTATIAWPNYVVSVAATVESDADNDGFGDDTQDACPTDATRQDACPAAPPAADKAPPVQTSTARRSQDVDKLTVFVTLNEAATVTARAGVNVPASARRFALRSVTRTVQANVRTRFRLKLRRTALRRVRKALARGRVLRARVTLTAKDAAANASVKRLSIRLKD